MKPEAQKLSRNLQVGCRSDRKAFRRQGALKRLKQVKSLEKGLKQAKKPGVEVKPEAQKRPGN